MEETGNEGEMKIKKKKKKICRKGMEDLEFLR